MLVAKMNREQWSRPRSIEDDSSNLKMKYGCKITAEEEIVVNCSSLKEMLAGTVVSSKKFDGKDVDSVLCKKLNQLSMEERNRGINDLHGVSDDDIMEETVEMMQTKLLEMKTLLSSTPFLTGGTDTIAYQKALQTNKEYVEEINRISLRGKLYDSQKAMANVVPFFSIKKELFGDENLCKHICLDDLDEEAMNVLKEGRVQLLEDRDQSGRAIIFIYSNENSHMHKLKAWFQAIYYVIMTALQVDEEIQRKGVVIIGYMNGQTMFKSKRPEKFAKMFECLPMRVAGIHLCYDTTVGHHFARDISLGMASDQCSRFRRHFGSHQDRINDLVTFGIPRRIIPIDMDTGKLNLQNHHKWIETMRTRKQQQKPETESTNLTAKLDTGFNHGSSSPLATRTAPSSTKRETINVPGKLDIVLGRGSHSRNSPAYMRFRTVLEKHRETYDNVERCHRMVIANQVLIELQHGGCRFLKMTPNGILVECDTRESEKKISHAFRNMRLKYKKRKNRQQQQQSSMQSNKAKATIVEKGGGNVGMDYQPINCGKMGNNCVGWPCPSVTISTNDNDNWNGSSTMDDTNCSSSSSSSSSESDDGAWLGC